MYKVSLILLTKYQHCKCVGYHRSGCGCLTDRLHYHVSTNLALLQANLTYMHARFGISYHWIPDLYRRMKLPV